MKEKWQDQKRIKSRCQIILDLDEAHGKIFIQEQCAKSDEVCLATVTNTVSKFAREGIEDVISYERSINLDNARRKVDRCAETRMRLLEEKCKVVLETPVSKDTICRTLKKLSKTI